MSKKRRELILAQVRQGHRIRRKWKGAQRSGYLSHTLLGVPRLKESEVELLLSEGLLEIVPNTTDYQSFGSLRYKELHQ